MLKVNLNVLTHTNELLPVQERGVRTFHFDGSTTAFLHLTGNQTPLVTPLPGDEYRSLDSLPKIANFVTVDLQQLAECVKEPCFFEILGFFARDFDVLDEKDQMQGQVPGTRPNVFVLYDGKNRFDSMLPWP